MKMQKIQNQLLTICLAVGFLIGILYENLFSIDDTILENITQNLQTEIVAEEYIWYILKLRIIPLAVILLFGTLQAKKVLSVMVTTWTGFLAGVFMVGAVVEMGAKGLLFSFVGIFPHMIFYWLSYGMILVYLFHYPRKNWNLSRTIFVILTMVLGVVTEVYLNPPLLRLLVPYLG